MTMTVDVVNYFEEIDIPFFFLCIVIFLVKINVTRVAIFFKAYFLNTYFENMDLCLGEKYTLTSI